MKSKILCTFLLLLPASLIAAEQITIESKLFGSSKVSMPHDLAKLSRAKGIDILSMPIVTTKSGQEANIVLYHECQPTSVAPSAFKPVPVGITIRVTPQLKDDRIAYTAQITSSDLVTSNTSGGQTISEITSRDLYVSGTPKDGEDVWLDFTAPGIKEKIVVFLRFKHTDA